MEKSTIDSFQNAVEKETVPNNILLVFKLVVAMREEIKELNKRHADQMVDILNLKGKTAVFSKNNDSPVINDSKKLLI